MSELTPGEITYHSETTGRSYTVRHMGTVARNRKTYQVQESTSCSEEFGTSVELQLVGPRGATYFLRPTYRAGIYRPFSMTGTDMTYQGNPVYVTVLGDLIEFTR